jgi:hypothetical protein
MDASVLGSSGLTGAEFDSEIGFSGGIVGSGVGCVFSSSGMIIL